MEHIYKEKVIMEYTISEAHINDEQMLCDMFLEHLGSHPEYISHGEIQMGVGDGHFEDGVLVTSPSQDARHFWMKYIHNNIMHADGAVVLKAVSSAGELLAFCVTEIQEDGADPYGMVCDLLVKDSCRGGGVGTALLESALEWLRSKGIADVYLESGLNNHAAHEYFKRRGFVKVSEIYKLQ